jgi:hypothetical protein
MIRSDLLPETNNRVDVYWGRRAVGGGEIRRPVHMHSDPIGDGLHLTTSKLLNLPLTV